MKNYIKKIKQITQKVIIRYRKQHDMSVTETHNNAPHGHLLFGRNVANNNNTHTSCCNKSCTSANTSPCNKRSHCSKCHCDITPCDVSKIVLC